MIQQPAMVRERLVLDACNDLCKRMQVRVADLFPAEHDIMNVLALRGDQDLAVELANFLMQRFGHQPTSAKEPRFSQTRRAMNKKRGKPPRGLKVAGG